MLPLPEVAERLGVDLVTVQTMVKEGALLAVRGEGGPAVPERVLDGDAVVKHFAAVLRLLRDGGYTDDEALRWMSTEDESLPGSPFDALHENRATEVKRRAQALAF